MTKRARQFLISTLSVFAMVWFLNYSRPMINALAGQARMQQERIQSAIASPLHDGKRPSSLRFPLEDGGFQRIAVSYTIDERIQHKMERLISQWKPDYCAFVALDAETGEVLSLISYARVEHTLGNLALRATYPAASVFKVVTAAAALGTRTMSPDTEIPFNGGDHTLYRRNVTSDKINRWTRKMSFRKAFARSVNTVFGKVGIELSSDSLRDYAEKFMFNQEIPGDLPVQPGTFRFEDEEDPFNVAEVASGFNREVMMSPLQGALIASVVANDGVLMSPFMVQSLLRWNGEPARDPLGELLYVAHPRALGKVITPVTAGDLRVLMKDTIHKGTARSAFSGVMNQISSEVFEIGGKTGTLRGRLPYGSNDWFVGYVLSSERRVALAALTVNIEKWRIKSATLARKFIQWYFPK